MLRSASVTFATSLLILSINVLSGIVIARVLGPVIRGIVTEFTTWTSVVYSASSIGIGSSAIFFINPSDDSSRRRFLSMSGISALGAGALGASVAVLLLGHVLWNGRGPQIFLFVLLCMTPLAVLVELSMAVRQSAVNLGVYNLFRIINPAIYALGLAGIYFTGFLSLRSALLVQITCAFISSAIIISRTRIFYTTFRWEEYVSHLHLTMGYGLKSYASSMLSLLDTQLPILVSSILLPQLDVGLLAVSISATSIVLVIGSTYQTVTFPYLRRMNGSGEVGAYALQILRRAVLYVSAVSVLLCAFVGKLVVLVYGVRYTAAEQVSELLALSAGLQAYAALCTGVLMALGKPLISAKGRTASIVLTPLLIVVFEHTGTGVSGVGLAVVCGALAYTGVTVNGISRGLGVKRREVCVPNGETVRLIWGDVITVGSYWRKLFIRISSIIKK